MSDQGEGGGLSAREAVEALIEQHTQRTRAIIRALADTFEANADERERSARAMGLPSYEPVQPTTVRELAAHDAGYTKALRDLAQIVRESFK